LAIRIFFNTAYYLYLMNLVSPNQPENSSTWPNGWWVSVVAETGSTNTDLLASAPGGAPHHSVLMAEFQSAGKGRLDRTWVAEPGSNLLVSLLFRFADTMQRPTHQFTQIVGMAAALASEQLVQVVPQMKWPNDLLIDGKKVSGILAQGAADFVVVGIGVNVGWAPPDAVSLNSASSHSQTKPIDLLRAMLGHIDVLEALDPAQLHARYVAQLMTLGQEVRVELAKQVVTGRASNVLMDGRLEVVDGMGQIHQIDTGDVVHLRAQ
jgi:BirA family biotin operon repressor/biotin-[acetyl-CoA-carboxylase] ligase